MDRHAAHAARDDRNGQCRLAMKERVSSARDDRKIGVSKIGVVKKWILASAAHRPRSHQA
ncbi:hypothetical protein [Helicobacter canis]|uniref:hypothetical protein n=1 Tax=Helicobacter canis TaxID=29419 RepID=UPI0011C05300|nr:hypothetical protein [Helicobacter canis]